jgi:hypothetical protein
MSVPRKPVPHRGRFEPLPWGRWSAPRLLPGRFAAGNVLAQHRQKVTLVQPGSLAYFGKSSVPGAQERAADSCSVRYAVSRAASAVVITAASARNRPRSEFIRNHPSFRLDPRGVRRDRRPRIRTWNLRYQKPAQLPVVLAGIL